MISEIATGEQARRAVESVDTLERDLLRFAHNSVRWLDPSFPSTGVRSPTQKGSWDDEGVAVLMTTFVEAFEGHGFQVIRLLRIAGNGGSVRIRAIGLPDGTEFEVRWSFIAAPDGVTGTSIELTANGLQEDEIVKDFRGWFG